MLLIFVFFLSNFINIPPDPEDDGGGEEEEASLFHLLPLPRPGGVKALQGCAQRAGFLPTQTQEGSFFLLCQGLMTSL